MDRIFKEHQVTDLSGRKRRLPHRFPVAKMGYMPRKRQGVHAYPVNACFNVILSGSGLLYSGNRKWAIEGPCMFTPMALEEVHYQPYDAWEEFYVKYPRETIREFEQSGYLSSASPVYPLPNLSRVLPILEEICSLLQRIHNPTEVDRIDSYCELLFRECLLAKESVLAGPEFQKMSTVRSYLDKNYLVDPDLTKLAKGCGMTPMTFRRTWARYFDLPPKQYVIQQRINQACRLLAETTLRVSEIAEQLAFRDPLYFSRVFRKKTGTTPSEYRNKYFY